MIEFLEYFFEPWDFLSFAQQQIIQHVLLNKSVLFCIITFDMFSLYVLAELTLIIKQYKI